MRLFMKLSGIWNQIKGGKRMNEFAEGQWVVITGNYLEGALGYITSIGSVQKQVWVRLVKNGKGKVVKGKMSHLFEPTELTPADLEGMNGCLYHLIDLALTTRDYEWLTALKQLEEK